MELRATFLVVLCMLSARVRGLQIQLGSVNVSLTPDGSCCGPSAHRFNRHCKCDPFCSVYGDCCLDYPLFFYIDDETRATVSEAGSNCSESSASGNWTSPSEGGAAGKLCTVWESDEAGVVDEAVREYVCLLRALWRPVILRRSTNRRFVPAPAIVSLRHKRVLLLEDCGQDASLRDTEACKMNRSLGSIQNLHDVISLLPVTARDGLHYKNIHCASCHGYDSRDAAFWSLDLLCHPPDLNVTALFVKNISRVAANCLISHLTKPREIPWTTAETRPEPTRGFECEKSPENADNAAACHAYSLPSNNYPNPHCEICISTNRTTGNDSSVSDGPECNNWLCQGGQPISALFDFSPATGSSLSMRGKETAFIVPDCDRGYAFDISTGRCRAFHCPSGQTLADDGKTCASLGNQTDQCTTRTEIMGDAGFFAWNFSVESDVSPHNASWREIVNLFQQMFAGQVQEWGLEVNSLGQSSGYNHCSSLTPYAYTFTFTGHQANTTVTSFSKATSEAVKTRCWKFANVTVAILELTVRNFEWEPLTNECAIRGREIEEHTPGETAELSVDGVPYVRITADDNQTVACPSLDTFQELVLIYGREFPTEPSVFSCRAKLYCPITVLNSSELIWLTDNGTKFATHVASGRNFSADNFIEMTGSDIAVCRPPLVTNAPVGQAPVPSTETVFSIVGIMVSQVFLLLSLLNYYMFPELRKLPGKNMISFIVALFSLQLAYLIGLGSPLSKYTLTTKASCLAFAVLTHYLLLTVFFWSNVISLHFVRTFGGRLRPRSTRSRHERRVFLLYSLYGWCAPAALVGTACAVHFTSDAGGPRDGVFAADLCLIPGGILYFFAIPSSVLLCLNVVFFVGTVVGIRRTRRAASFARKERTRLETIKMDFNLCLKVSVATGMLWLVLFILGSVKVEGMSYLLTLDFTLQGPLVFFAFAFTGRVRGLWRKKLCASAAKESQRASQDRTCGSGGTRSTTDGLMGGDTVDEIHIVKLQPVHSDESTFINPLYGMIDTKAQIHDSNGKMNL